MDQPLDSGQQDSQLLAEDAALHLFQIAALMLGDEQEAVCLVENTLARVESDPCADSTGAYIEARTLLVRDAIQRMAGLHPAAFAVPAAVAADAVCLESDDLDSTGIDSTGLAGEQFTTLVTGPGRVRLREWLDRLGPALRAIFVLRAVAGQNGEQTAETLRQSGVKGANAWRKDQVGAAYRQALCSLATCLMTSRTSLSPA